MGAKKRFESFPEQKKIFDQVLRMDLFKVDVPPLVPGKLYDGPKIPKEKGRRREIGEEEKA